MCKINKLSDAMQQVVAETVDGRIIKSLPYEDQEKALIGQTHKAQEMYLEMLEENNVSNKEIVKVYVVRVKEQDTVYISRHAFKRMKERNGWNRKASMRMVEKVVESGMRERDMEYKIRQWVKIKNAMRKKPDTDCEIILYGSYIYIFSKSDNTLLTSYSVPNSVVKNKNTDVKNWKRKYREEACLA